MIKGINSVNSSRKIGDSWLDLHSAFGAHCSWWKSYTMWIDNGKAALKVVSTTERQKLNVLADWVGYLR